MKLNPFTETEHCICCGKTITLFDFNSNDGFCDDCTKEVTINDKEN